MKIRLATIVAALIFVMIAPSVAGAKNKKKQAPRGIVESMQSVPCGVKERGFTGIGAVWGSAGIHHVNSDEKLCPQYLFRTDEMDYHIRPADLKHAILLPIGHEAEFKVKKNRLFLKVPDGDKKTRAYQVISMEQKKSASETENTAYNPVHTPVESPRLDGEPNRQVTSQPVSPPPQ